MRDLRPTGTSLDPVHARPDRPPPASAGPRGVSLAHGVDREPETRQLNVRHPWRIPPWRRSPAQGACSLASAAREADPAPVAVGLAPVPRSVVREGNHAGSGLSVTPALTASLWSEAGTMGSELEGGSRPPRWWSQDGTGQPAATAPGGDPSV